MLGHKLYKPSKVLGHKFSLGNSVLGNKITPTPSGTQVKSHNLEIPITNIDIHDPLGLKKERQVKRSHLEKH
jgi:hypothetical protein